MWQMHTVEYYLAIERNKGLTRAPTWTNLENILLRGRSQLLRTYYRIPFPGNGARPIE